MNTLIPWKWGKKNLPVKGEDSRPEDNSLFSLQQDMNRIFQNFFHTFDADSFATSGHFSEKLFQPRIDFSENSNQLKISVELPGLDEKELDVSVSKEALTIKGEKREEKEENTNGYYRMERHYGSFHRTIAFPCGVEKDGAEATFKNGVLTIVLPKTQEAQAAVKKIPVKKASPENNGCNPEPSKDGSDKQS
ncbi:Hsp20/alpha crystallin family protein [soil metagenome]